MELKHVYQKSLTGLKWGVLTHLVYRIGGFVPSIVLARLLHPADYGLVGMATTIAGVLSIFSEVGLGQALLQCREEVESRANQALSLNFSLGLLMTLAQFLLAPAAARFYGVDELTSILRVSSVGYAIAALGSISGVMLQKHMAFKTINAIDLSAFFTRLILSLTLAFAGYAYWSIIVGELGARAATTVLRLWHCPWRPRLTFNVAGAGVMFRFGKYVYLTNILNYLMSNTDFICLGKFFGAAVLGPYYFAYNLVMLFQQIVAGLAGTITMPAVAVLNEESRKEYFRRTVQVICISAVPIFAFLVAGGPSMIKVAFGDKWSGASMPLMFLAVFGGVRTLVSPFGSYSWASGDSRTPFYWHVVMAPVLSLITFTAAHYGIAYVAAATGIVYSAAYLSFALLISKAQRFSLSRLVASIAPPVAVVAAVGTALALLNQHINMPPTLMLLVNIVFYTTLVLLGWLVFARRTLVDLRFALSGGGSGGI
jgi:O-antigen/teichoic acid export membrane protein